MKISIYLTVLALGLFVPAEAVTDDEQLFVTTMQAKPGKFRDFLAELKTIDWERAKTGAPVVMRHSVGDAWDIMMLGKTYDNCAEDDSVCSDERVKFLKTLQNNVDLNTVKSWYVTSPEPWSKIAPKAHAAGLYYVEMFTAIDGMESELLQQRKNENAYLVGTGQKANSIFINTEDGGVDVFTVGYFEDMKHFAVSPDLTMDEQNRIARESGFVDRADLSFSLRAVISSHHDTLATRVD